MFLEQLPLGEPGAVTGYRCGTITRYIEGFVGMPGIPIEVFIPLFLCYL